MSTPLARQAKLLRADVWRYFDGLSDEQLDVEVDAWDGAVARSFLVSHVTLEIALHSAEVGTMRHLWRATRP